MNFFYNLCLVDTFIKNLIKLLFQSSMTKKQFLYMSGYFRLQDSQNPLKFLKLILFLFVTVGNIFPNKLHSPFG